MVKKCIPSMHHPKKQEQLSFSTFRPIPLTSCKGQKFEVFPSSFIHSTQFSNNFCLCEAGSRPGCNTEGRWNTFLCPMWNLRPAIRGLDDVLVYILHSILSTKDMQLILLEVPLLERQKIPATISPTVDIVGLTSHIHSISMIRQLPIQSEGTVSDLVLAQNLGPSKFLLSKARTIKHKAYQISSHWRLKWRIQRKIS